MQFAVARSAVLFKEEKKNIQFGIKLKPALKEMCLQSLFVFFPFIWENMSMQPERCLSLIVLTGFFCDQKRALSAPHQLCI